MIGEVWSYKDKAGNEHKLTWTDCATAVHSGMSVVEKLMVEDKELSDTKHFYYERVSAILGAIHEKFRELAIAFEESQRRIPKGGRR